MPTPPSQKLRARLLADFAAAYTFVQQRHPTDLRWIMQRRSLVQSFDDFFEEYVYVVVASGFKGSIAGRLTPQLVAHRGNLDRMLSIFKNRAKCEAIHSVYKTYGGDGNGEMWASLRASFKSCDDLVVLPRIGPTVKLHLGRNIGLVPDAVKPDLHLVRYAEELGVSSAEETVKTLRWCLQHQKDGPTARRRVQKRGRQAKLSFGNESPTTPVTCFPVALPPVSVVAGMKLGTLDFILWVWLSHKRGTEKLPCCDGACRIR